MPLAPLRRLGDGSRPVGWEIIEAVDGDLGLVLWHALRSIYEWAKPTEDKSERLRLFGARSASAEEQLRAACGEAPQIADALQKIGLLRQSAGDVQPDVIGTACAAISAWAERRSLIDVAAHFAEAGAYADPLNPALANAAGKLCRRIGLLERSAAWFKRGRYAAIRTRNRAERIRALLGYGALMRGVGRYEEAQAYFTLAANLAERTRRRRQAAEAHHDLLAIAILMDDLPTAEEHVWEALRLYPGKHLYLPAVGHDWAFALILRRHYSHAVPLVEAAISRIRLPELRTLMFSTLARAAAGARQLDIHVRAEAEALRYIERFPEHAAPALLNLAQAAWLLEKWELALDFVRRAKQAGHAHPDKRFVRDAADLLQQLRRRDSPPSEQIPALPDIFDSVQRRYLARLQEAPPPPREGGDGRLPA
jgi:tetratricopeptide (TPR) repeat protein